MAPEDLADDLSAGLIRRWIEGRGALTAEEGIRLSSWLASADDALRRQVNGVIQAHVDDQQWERLARVLRDELVRRGEIP
jgi:hypothetical protein